MEDLSADPAIPKGQQTTYNGVYVLQHRQEADAPKMSRFGTREQVSLDVPLLFTPIDLTGLQMSRFCTPEGVSLCRTIAVHISRAPWSSVVGCDLALSWPLGECLSSIRKRVAAQLAVKCWSCLIVIQACLNLQQS